MDLLRLCTSGSVDDGKSTLIGRLLYDTKSIYEDQLRQIEALSLKRSGALDLALLTDGLRAEREQGITIDVAYRYFSTPRRKFILADTPGHVQYTRNMLTGAATAGAALVLVDAQKGVVEQTRRHALIASLMGVHQIIVCVNKMDLVAWSQGAFSEICAAFAPLAQKLDAAVSYVPLSALHGDNIVEPSARLAWYEGHPLLAQLEQLPLLQSGGDPRFIIQLVQRPPPGARGRRYLGFLASGELGAGDRVTALPQGQTTRVREIARFEGPLERATAGQAVSLTLDDDIDLGRGDMLTAHAAPAVAPSFDAVLCWLDSVPLDPARRYWLLHTTSETYCQVQALHTRFDLSTLEERPAEGGVGPNDIVRVALRAARPLAFDTYRKNRITGSVLLVDETSHQTAAAGLIA